MVSPIKNFTQNSVIATKQEDQHDANTVIGYHDLGSDQILLFLKQKVDHLSYSRWLVHNFPYIQLGGRGVLPKY